MSYTSLKETLKSYSIDFLEMSLYDAAKLSEDELKSKIKDYYETQLGTLSTEEIEDKLGELTDQISAAYKEAHKLLKDLEEKIEDNSEAGKLAEVSGDRRLLNELQEFLNGDGLDFYEKNSSLIIPYISHLSNLIVSSEEDEYFIYDTSEDNVIYGGEIVRYNLLAKQGVTPLGEPINFGDTDGDGITDVDANADGLYDKRDQIDDGLYDMSGQDLFIEINPGDKIISTFWDSNSKVLSFEIETTSRTVNSENGAIELSQKTFMLEVEIQDLKAARIFLTGENYATEDVFKNLDSEVLNILFDNDSVKTMLSTLKPDENTPSQSEQLSAIAGYETCVDSIQDSIDDMNAVFAMSEDNVKLPQNAESILKDLYTLVFDNELVNSLSNKTADEVKSEFYATFEKYSKSEQAALAMVFCYNFIQSDPGNFKTLMQGEVFALQTIINQGDTSFAEPQFLASKILHTLIENTMGFGKYTGNGLSGDLFTRGTAFATAAGVTGDWSNHKQNSDVLQFLITHDFDTTGVFSEAKVREDGLLRGEISTTDGFALQNELTSLLSAAAPINYWKGGNLGKKEWDEAIHYLKNHLVNSKGELCKDPVQVFRDCLEKFFKKDGQWTNAADNFASAFLYACDLNGSGVLSQSLMQGPFGADITKLLWNACDNGSDKPPYYEEAKRYKNLLSKEV